MVSVPDDVKDRVLSYIAHQSQKQAERIAGVVEQGHDQIVGLLEDLSDEQAAFKASAEDWSVLEVLRHVVGSKRGVARRCSVLARGEASASFEPADEVGVFASLSEARAALDARPPGVALLGAGADARRKRRRDVRSPILRRAQLP